MMSPTKRPGPSRRIQAAIFVVITLILLAAGYGYYRKQATDIRREKHEAIAAIGELKSGQIQQWRKERLADAKRFAKGPVLSRAAADFLLNPSSPGYRAILLEQMQLDRMVDQYHDVLLFAPDGQMILSTKDAPAPVDPATQRIVAAALTSQEPLLSDFFREPDGTVHIDAAAAVRDAKGQPLAVMILRSDADAYLFPLIQSWPTPSPSAETLLVQRDGEEILYLNALRHRSQTAMTLRVPISRTDLPAAQALRGKQGEFQGKDYRNVEVLADLRSVPNSPWFLVAKVNANEILAEARYRAGLISLMVGSFILLAAVATAYVYRHQQAGLFRDLYDSERQQREAQKTFRATLYSIGDAVITTDRGGFVREMNPVAEKLTAWTEAEAHGKPLEQVFHIINEDSRATMENPVDQVLRMGAVVGLANHTLLIARDGTERPISDSAAPIRDDSGDVNGVVGVVLVFSDQTAERTVKRELRKSEQHLRAIIEAEPECVKLLDQSGKLLEMNPAGLAMLEADSLQDVQGRGLIGFISPEFHAAFRALHKRVMRGGSGTLEFEITGLKGTRRWLETHAAPLRDANGHVSMLLGITRDITERKAAETGLLQRSRQLAVLSTASQHINTVLEIPAVMRQLVTTALELTGATDGAAARLLDGKMIFKEYNLHDKWMLIDFEFETGYGVPGWVMQTRAPYTTNDAEHDPHVIPDIQKALGFHNLADVPIINRHGELLGCFEIHNKPGGFNDTDLIMLQGLAASAAIALENAELLAERKRSEETLRASLQEKESLLKEVHHRVKNNLQVVTSLLRLEAGRSNQPDTKSVLKEMQNRIRSMALLHETLYRSENLERVDLPGYIKHLTTHLYRSMVADPESIQLHLDLAPASLALDQAVPCGLLINELVSNCLKHGFPDGRKGEVRIELQPMDGAGTIRLRVSDTGVGLPTDFEEKRTKSLGLQLVSDLIKQLKGQLEIDGGPGVGAVFEVTFVPKGPAEAIT